MGEGTIEVTVVVVAIELTVVVVTVKMARVGDVVWARESGMENRARQRAAIEMC